MNNIQLDKNFGLTALAILSILAAIVLGALQVLRPIETPGAIASRQSKAMQDVKNEATEAQTEATKLKAKIASLTWAGAADTVVPSAIAIVKQRADARQLTLRGFRPLTAKELEGLEMMPYTISLEGRYPNILQFAKDLETNGGKLAVNLVQIASADEATDQVSATIGIVAYRLLEDTKK